ncbi:MAG TPA: putative glycolipid-binding domain-containing protein [Mycobacteriales bacterium]
MGTRVITWRADERSGEQRLEQVRVHDDLGALRARGTILVASGELVGSGDLAGPYRVDYELDTGRDLATHRLVVRTEGAGWRRELWLRRDPDGTWTCRRLTEPDMQGPAPTDVAELAGALDTDLVSSALFNTMPIRRSGLHEKPGTEHFLMAWVSIPDLTVTPSHQTYGHVRPGVVSFDSEGGFTAEVEVDADGYVSRYPSVALRC